MQLKKVLYNTKQQMGTVSSCYFVWFLLNSKIIIILLSILKGILSILVGTSKS